MLSMPLQSDEKAFVQKLVRFSLWMPVALFIVLGALAIVISMVYS